MLTIWFILPTVMNERLLLGHVIQVDEYIIQIDHNTDIQKIRENVIYELLEGHGSISKIERHYRPFK